MIDLMFKHLQQLTNLLLLEIGGAFLFMCLCSGSDTSAKVCVDCIFCRSLK